MTDINMLPDTHCFDDDSQTDVWSYSAGLVSELIEATRQEGLKQGIELSAATLNEQEEEIDVLRAKLAEAEALVLRYRTAHVQQVLPLSADIARELAGVPCGDEALTALLAEQRERCAVVADRADDHFVADKIREMK